MGKRRIKVFASGNYPQGDYSKERVKEIFSNIKDKVQGIFVHSSKWKKEERSPIELGQFDNFTIKEDGDQAEVYADINFNDKGNSYYNDGIFKGVSVEIDAKANKLDKIAILPIGTSPAVQGAEFEKKDMAIINFMEEKEMNKEEREALLKSLTVEELQNLQIDGYQITVTATNTPTESTEESKEESKEEPKEEVKEEAKEEKVEEEKTEEEVESKEETKEEMEKRIREEMRQEYELKVATTQRVNEFMEAHRSSITPALKKVLNPKTLNDIFSSEAVVEFEEKSISIAAFLDEFMKAMPKFKSGELNMEFGEVEKKGKTANEVSKEYKELTKRILKP